jgi:hypothetical protein
MILAQ